MDAWCRRQLAIRGSTRTVRRVLLGLSLSCKSMWSCRYCQRVHVRWLVVPRTNVQCRVRAVSRWSATPPCSVLRSLMPTTAFTAPLEAASPDAPSRMPSLAAVSSIVVWVRARDEKAGQGSPPEAARTSDECQRIAARIAPLSSGPIHAELASSRGRAVSTASWSMISVTALALLKATAPPCNGPEAHEASLHTAPVAPLVPHYRAADTATTSFTLPTGCSVMMPAATDS
jgi:hypothetical protein